MRVERRGACCLRQNIQPGRTRPRSSSAARFWDNGRGGAFISAGRVVRVEPLPPLAQQLFHPSACARQVCHMSLLPLLCCAVIRALERLGAHPAGLGAHKARPLAGRFPSEWAYSPGVCPEAGRVRAARGCPSVIAKAKSRRQRRFVAGAAVGFGVAVRGCSTWARGGLLMRTGRSGEHQEC